MVRRVSPGIRSHHTNTPGMLQTVNMIRAITTTVETVVTTLTLRVSVRFEETVKHWTMGICGALRTILTREFLRVRRKYQKVTATKALLMAQRPLTEVVKVRR